MTRYRLLALLPHYVASLLLILGAVWLLRSTLGDPGFLVELVVVVGVVLAYPTVVRWLGVAPAAWEHPPDD